MSARPCIRAVGHSTETAHALRDVGLEADPALFPVIELVDANLYLLIQDMSDAGLNSFLQGSASIVLPASRSISILPSGSPRGRLPAWVTKMRSQLFCMFSSIKLPLLMFLGRRVKEGEPQDYYLARQRHQLRFVRLRREAC